MDNNNFYNKRGSSSQKQEFCYTSNGSGFHYFLTVYVKFLNWPLWKALLYIIEGDGDKLKGEVNALEQGASLSVGTSISSP